MVWLAVCVSFILKIEKDGIAEAYYLFDISVLGFNDLGNHSCKRPIIRFCLFNR